MMEEVPTVLSRLASLMTGASNIDIVETFDGIFIREILA
jgi:hypothetical protein